MPAATATPRRTPRPVAQSISGSSTVPISVATINGTVADRAYQMAPPINNTTAVTSSTLALQRAISVPAGARSGTTAAMMALAFDAGRHHPFPRRARDRRYRVNSSLCVRSP
jgi:hypothetical protein